VDWPKSPPKIVQEEAALDAAAAAASDLAAMHVLADLCQSRITTPAKLRQALHGRRRLPRGVWSRRIIEDLGACSALEHGYLVRVERRHGLPRVHRQMRGSAAGRTAWRDITYPVAGRSSNLTDGPSTTPLDCGTRTSIATWTPLWTRSP
jgi:hypothetical protein